MPIPSGIEEEVDECNTRIIENLLQIRKSSLLSDYYDDELKLANEKIFRQIEREDRKWYYECVQEFECFLDNVKELKKLPPDLHHECSLVATETIQEEPSAQFATRHYQPVRNPEPGVESLSVKPTVTVGDHTLTAEDMKTLCPDSWLNNHVVNAFFSILGTICDGCYALPAILSTKENPFPKEKIDQVPFAEYRWILQPICRWNHWTLLVVDTQMKTVSVLDSSEVYERREMFVTLWQEYIKERNEWLDLSMETWTEKRVVSSQQEDNNSCGVFVMMNAVAFVRGQPPSIAQQCHVNAFREKVLMQFLRRH